MKGHAAAELEQQDGALIEEEDEFTDAATFLKAKDPLWEDDQDEDSAQQPKPLLSQSRNSGSGGARKPVSVTDQLPSSSAVASTEEVGRPSLIPTRRKPSAGSSTSAAAAAGPASSGHRSNQHSSSSSIGGMSGVSVISTDKSAVMDFSSAFSNTALTSTMTATSSSAVPPLKKMSSASQLSSAAPSSTAGITKPPGRGPVAATYIPPTGSGAPVRAQRVLGAGAAAAVAARAVVEPALLREVDDDHHSSSHRLSAQLQPKRLSGMLRSNGAAERALGSPAPSARIGGGALMSTPSLAATQPIKFSKPAAGAGSVVTGTSMAASFSHVRNNSDGASSTSSQHSSSSQSAGTAASSSGIRPVTQLTPGGAMRKPSAAAASITAAPSSSQLKLGATAPALRLPLAASLSSASAARDDADDDDGAGAVVPVTVERPAPIVLSSGECNKILTELKASRELLRSIDANWTLRMKEMTKLEALVRVRRADCLPAAAWSAELVAIGKCLAIQFEDLRSSIVRESCRLMVCVAPIL